MHGVVKIDKAVAAMSNAPQNISYTHPHSVCVHFFGEARQSGTSHAVFKTPWQGDPRLNIQKAKGGKAKPYQVRQALKAIDKLQEVQK
ncbi:MAG: toxin HicA [Candidatus Microthrix sp.]|nr:toxin HicA [Candidatus Microthrix sp.]